MSSEPAPGARMLFAWEKARRFRWRLFGLFALSFLAHIATFFVFQITYPPRVSIPPPAPEVSLLLPTTPENRALLRWIAAEDPALVANATVVVPPALAEVKYRPSFETIRTQPRNVPEQNAAVRFPPPREPLAIIRSGSTGAPASSRIPAQPAATQLQFSDELRRRKPATPAAWSFSKRSPTPLTPASYLLGVTDRGEVRFVFPQASSGLPELDREVAGKIAALPFEHGETPIIWGFATVVWGDDAYLSL